MQLVYDNAYLTENLIVWLDGTDNVISVTSDLVYLNVEL